MTDIRYVCLSDLHLGADNSILTNLGSADNRVDPSQPSKVLVELANCLRTLISRNSDDTRPTLVLNGDIFELALAPDNVAAMAFQRFLELVMPEDSSQRLFGDKIVFNPGNHDHHLWETARETQYADFLEGLGPAKILPEPWHTTKMIDEKGVPSRFVDVLVHRYPWLRNVSSVIVYPNFGIVSGNGSRLVIFSHGHYTEPIYMLMTTLSDDFFPGRRRGNAVYDVEAENFAWVDFFWSTMGRSGGEVGGNVERIYNSMQDPNAFAKILARFAGSLLKKYGRRFYIRSRLVRRVFVHILTDLISGRPERAKHKTVLSDNGEGLRNFVRGPVKEQLNCELDSRPMPEDVTFIFGHTHKPFEEMMRISDFSVDPVAVYNSGGWVVDRPKPQALYGGAVILLDGNLDVVSLRMYNEAENTSQYAVKLRAAWPPAALPTPFYQRIDALIRADGKPWQRFSEAAAEAVTQHTQKLARELGQST